MFISKTDRKLTDMLRNRDNKLNCKYLNACKICKTI